MAVGGAHILGQVVFEQADVNVVGMIAEHEEVA